MLFTRAFESTLRSTQVRFQDFHNSGPLEENSYSARSKDNQTY